MPRFARNLRALKLAVPVLLAGCGTVRNSMPIAQGVPDGFVLARELDPASNERVRVERVVFAYQNQRCSAVIATPRSGTGLEAVFQPDTPAPEMATQAEAGKVIISSASSRASVQKLAGTLAEVGSVRF